MDWDRMKKDMREIKISKSDFALLILMQSDGKNISVAELMEKVFNKKDLSENVSCLVYPNYNEK